MAPASTAKIIRTKHLFGVLQKQGSKELSAPLSVSSVSGVTRLLLELGAELESRD